MLSRIRSKMKSKSYRAAFSRSRSAAVRAAQIIAMRHERGWSQAYLANIVGMKQSRICLLEDPNYQSVSLATLQRMAEAFDVALSVEFSGFGKLAESVDRLDVGDLTPPSFDRDPLFMESASTQLPAIFRELLAGEQQFVSLPALDPLSNRKTSVSALSGLV
jgi:transcriptional regulator with XRE-family HTH domain